MKITYKDFLEIQKLKKQGITRNEAVLKTKYTQYVIYKYWDMPEDVFLKEKDQTKSEYSKYRDIIIEIINENSTLPANVIHDRLKERVGAENLASMNSFYRYLKSLKQRMGLSDKKVSVRQMVEETPMGEEAQVDFGQYQMPNMYGGVNRVYFFCMVLSYSRMKYVYFLSEPFDSLTFAYAHELAFKYFDGRPKRILYDQDRTMVVSENCGNIIFTKEFDAYRRTAGFEAMACKPYDPDSKGKVENVVKFVKQNFLEGREYCGIDALNNQCLAWLDRTGNGKIHQATKKTPSLLYHFFKFLQGVLYIFYQFFLALGKIKIIFNSSHQIIYRNVKEIRKTDKRIAVGIRFASLVVRNCPLVNPYRFCKVNLS